MKRFILALIMILCLATSAMAVDVWTYKPTKIGRPSLVQLKIVFVLLLNGEEYATDSIRLSPDELDGKTLTEKKQYLNNKVKEKCSDYIRTNNIAEGLISIIGTEVSAE